MTEALKCPECSAPLEYPAGGGTTMRCPYCNCTVLLSGNSPSAVEAQDPRIAAGPMAGRAAELAEVVNLLRAGNKIGAIRLYRQMFSVDLATAKDAVEKHAGQQQGPAPGSRAGMYNFPDPARAASGALKAGCGAALGIIVLVGLILSFVFFSVRRQFAKVKPSWTPPSFVTGSPRALAPLAPPGLARMVLEFGTEGIGAGGFKDARSIATDGQGHFYVGEYSDGRIQVFDAQGKFLSTWSIDKGTSLLNLTADRHGTVFAIVPSHIYGYEGATGKLLGDLAGIREGDEQQYYSDAFAALDGDVYALGNNHNIVDFGPDGHIKRTLNLREKVGEDVSFDRFIVISTGEIYALDRSKGVFKFAPDGRYINRFGGGHDHAPGHLLSPRNLAADGKGRIYVTDSGAAVQVFDDEGAYLGSFGGSEVAFGLAITDQNEIYACFRNRHSVRKYVLERK